MISLPHKSNTRERTRGRSLTRFTDAPKRCATNTSSPVGYTHQTAVTHTRSGAEPLPTIRRLLGDKCNDRHKACRPHLSHNVFDRYPHRRELQRARIRPTWKQRHTCQLHREGGSRHTATRPYASTIASDEYLIPAETGVAGGPHKSYTQERTRGRSLTRFTDAPKRCSTNTSSATGYTHQPAVT